MSANSMEDIAEVIRKIKFKKQIFGGVNEKAVWKEIQKLQNEYRSAYEKQAAAYEALIKERDDKIKELEGGSSEVSEDE